MSFTVRNDGAATGTVTPQLYLTLPASTGEPGHRLVGYSQITLKPGQSREITLTVEPNSAAHPLSTHDTTSSSWITTPGTVRIR